MFKATTEPEEPELTWSQGLTLDAIRTYKSTGCRVTNPQSIQDCEVLEELGLVHQVVTRGNVRWVAGQPKTACGRMVAGSRRP